MNRLDETYLLLVLRELKTVGRYRLSAILQKPEGAVRGILRRYRQRGMIISKPRKGVSLTAKGLQKLNQLLSDLSIGKTQVIKGKMLGVGPENVLLHIKDKGHQVKLGVEQRDAAVAAGARGALILVYKNHILSLPGVYRDIARDPGLERNLLRGIHTSENDILAVSFAEAWWKAMRGGIAIAESLS